MTEYFDTPILVFACNQNEEVGAKSRKLISEAKDGVTTPHALAECFNTLTYRLRIPPVAAQKMISKISEKLRFQSLTEEDYKIAIDSVVDNGQTGDKIYDALHVRAAALCGANKIHTSNRRDFAPFHPAAEIVRMLVPA